MSSQLDKAHYFEFLGKDSSVESSYSSNATTGPHFDSSIFEIIEPQKKLVVFSSNQELFELVSSLELERTKVTLVSDQSELVKLCTSGYVDLVIVDLDSIAEQRILALCYEIRRHSIRTIPFAFCGPGTSTVSLSQKIYAGASVQFEWGDSSDFIKQQIYIALLQSGIDRIKILVYRKNPVLDFCQQLKSHSVTCGLLKDLNHLDEVCLSFRPRMIFLQVDCQSELIEIVGRFKEMSLNVPVVGICPKLDSVSRLRVLKAGVDEVLVSPVHIDDLMSCIKMQLRFSFLRSKYAQNKLMGRFLTEEIFEEELEELLAASRAVDSKVAVCAIKIQNYDEIVSRRGLLTATLCNENLVELVKTRFRIQDLVSRTERNEILFAFPNEDKEMGNRLMIDLELEISKYKLTGTSDTLKVCVCFGSCDSTDYSKKSDELISEAKMQMYSD